MEDGQVRDIPKALVIAATLLAVAGCVALGVTVDPAWHAVAAAVLMVGVSLAPKYGPGHPERWGMPAAVMQAVGLAAIPGSVALSLADGTWWWLAGGALVLLLAAVVSSELDKPRAVDR